MLAKNRACEVLFNEFLWSRVSPEARDLVARMIAKDPKERITAKDALAHPWFMLENTDGSLLDTAQANIRKHCRENMFCVQRIKPEFTSIMTISPLLHSKYAAVKDSPLQLPSARDKVASPLFSPRDVPSTCREETKAQVRFHLINLSCIIEHKWTVSDPQHKGPNKYAA